MFQKKMNMFFQKDAHAFDGSANGIGHMRLALYRFRRTAFFSFSPKKLGGESSFYEDVCCGWFFLLRFVEVNGKRKKICERKFLYSFGWYLL